MEFSELINSRYSARKYNEDNEISQELLLEIIEETQKAPSWKNTQCTRYHCVLSESMKQLVREYCLPAFNAKNTENAAALIISTVKTGLSGYQTPNGDLANELGENWGVYDVGIHDAYLLLSAKNRGIDSLVMGIRDAQALAQYLKIPEDEMIVSVISLGYSDSKTIHREKKSASEIASFY